MSLVACGHPAPVPVPTPIAHAPDAAVADAKLASEDERLAAIQKAMNELDEAVQGCWAVVATERFDVEGDLTAQIEIGAHGAKATLVLDTARNAKLAACVVAVLDGYPWAPPLHGQTIQLPFRFRAPSDGQNVIDRKLVSAVGQGDVRISVLIDENNTSNDHASMFEVAIAPKGTTAMRRADRTELWYFKTAADVKGPTTSSSFAVAAGDMVFVPQYAAREIRAREVAVDAVLVIVPGGREGSARAGALSTPIDAHWEKTPQGPRLLPAAGAKTYPRGPGKVAIQLDGQKELAASIVEFPSGMAIPEHVHAGETELLYVLAGTGTLTVKGEPLPIIATSVVQIPPETKHAFVATSDLRAVQIYTPAGPEQRFKTP